MSYLPGRPPGEPNNLLVLAVAAVAVAVVLCALLRHRRNAMTTEKTEYLPEPIAKILEIASLSNRAVATLQVLSRYGQTDGAHHKAWVIDQALRALLGSDRAYHLFRAQWETEFSATWDKGIAP
jgi:hypothetical protein